METFLAKTFQIPFCSSPAGLGGRVCDVVLGISFVYRGGRYFFFQQIREQYVITDGKYYNVLGWGSTTFSVSVLTENVISLLKSGVNSSLEVPYQT